MAARSSGSTLQARGPVVAVIAVGGALGALARYAASELWPTAPGTFPTTTFAINVLGSALIGVVVVLVTDVWAAPAGSARTLLRPFLVTGVLGGFTTFSAYSLETERLFRDGQPLLALTYAALTVLAAVAAVTLSTLLTRRVVGPARRGSA